MGLTVLVTGASGFVGSTLIPRLLEDGHRVRAFVRDASHFERDDVEVVEGDAESGEGLPEAMEGVDVVFFLIHSMEGSEAFGETERKTAQNAVDAAEQHGVRRVVYLGGIVPEEDSAGGSEHLESRREVEQQLLDGFPEGVALRASMLIGARSRSFAYLVEIVEKMPVLALPAWQKNATAPIDARDAIEYLARAATADLQDGASEVFDIGGPEVMSYGDMVKRIAALDGEGHKRSFAVPVSITPIAARVGAAIAGEDAALIEPLMESLEYDLVPDDQAARETFGVRPRSFEDSVRWALEERAAAAAAG